MSDSQDSIENLNNNIKTTSNPDSDPSLQSSQPNTTSDQPEKKDEFITASVQPEKKDEEINKQPEEEEGECGFCLYMKGGECKEQFINWEKCIYEAEELNVDVVEKCIQVTELLKKCMEANSDYYSPILSAEKSSEEAAALTELEKEKMYSDQNEVPIVSAEKSAIEEALEKEKMHSDQNEVKHSTG